MWSNWTECSSTCNEGVQYRERQCTNPLPQNGGKDCLVIGPATDKRSCFITKCPGKIAWRLLVTGSPGETYFVELFLDYLLAVYLNESDYTEWSECTKSCGMGIQSRASKNGEQTQSRFCNTDQCPGMCRYYFSAQRVHKLQLSFSIQHY